MAKVVVRGWPSKIPRFGNPLMLVVPEDLRIIVAMMKAGLFKMERTDGVEIDGVESEGEASGGEGSDGEGSDMEVSDGEESEEK